MTAILLKTTEFAVFWLILTIKLFGWSRLVLRCPTFTASLDLSKITISITVTHTFYNFFSSLARTNYLSLFSFYLIFTLWSSGMARFTIRQIHSFVISHLVSTSGRDWVISFMSKSQRILCVSFSRTDTCFCIYICSYGQISISFTVNSGSPTPPNHV